MSDPYRLALIDAAARAPLRMRAPNARHTVSSHRARELCDGWELVGVPPDLVDVPMRLESALEHAGERFASIRGALPVAAALRQLGRLDMNALPELDGRDWWYRCSFDADRCEASEAGPRVLCFDGLATIVDVWLNGTFLGRSNDMFAAWEADVSSLLGDANVLVLCARAMTARLAPRRPRARWRSRLMASQEWRWHRTTQLGRMPGFGPALPPVGPWRPVRLEHRAGIEVDALAVTARRTSRTSALTVALELVAAEQPSEVRVHCGQEHIDARVTKSPRGWRVDAELASDRLGAWWPHTHGDPVLHDAWLSLAFADGDVRLDLGAIGFRALEIDSSAGGLAVTVNGVRPFLRGSCWNPRDWAMPDPAVGDIERELDLLRDAGINCIRLSGCFTYGSAALIAACDRRGVLVWHDLMFSVLDYPAHDEAFVALCESEVAQQVALLQGSPSVLAICGSSEVEQQAAMSGVELAAVPHPLFHDLLARVVKHTLPDAAYWPSTPFGGEIPFRTDVGTTHYFGVGAYRRPLDDARRAAVRFATECLAFSHLPEPESPSSLPYDAADAESHARWKSRIPRDGGADWDFEDVRDHYVDALFGVESSSLRLGDPLRYLALGRAASAIVVERTMHEFRRTASSCQGALTWLWSDPWAGAGWGLVDSVGRPKSAWYAMRRALRSVGMALTDEGLNGVAVHLWNDSPHAVEGELHVRLLRADGSVVQAGICRLTVPAHDGHVRSTTEVLGRFVDPSCAYRFGADRHDAVHAVWLASGSADDRSAARGSSFEGRALIDDAVLLVAGDRRAPSPTGLDARVDHREHDGTVALAISSSRVAQAVRIGSVSHRADDSYFTLAPGVTRLVRLVPQSADAEVDALVVIECLNDASAIRLQVPWPNALVESPRVPRLLSPTGVESRC